MGNSESLKLAEQAIDEFENSTIPGVWVGLDKQTIIKELRSRIANPFSVNQQSQPFCGPASIIFELIRKQPDLYVQICRHLFQIGGFHTQTNRWIYPSSRLLNSQGNFKMPQVDWMLLSTLRESENLIFPVEPDAPALVRNLAGMTKTWEMAGWIQEILGYQKTKYLNAYLSKDVQVLQEATQIVNAGGVAFALINDLALLLNKPPAIPYPSHWVALLGNLSLEDNNLISFNVYTWGKMMTITINLDLFKIHFWEVVAGI